MVAEKELAEHAVSLEHLKEGGSYGKMFFKSGFVELEDKAGWSRVA